MRTKTISTVLATSKVTKAPTIKMLAQTLKEKLHITAIKRRDTFNERQIFLIISKGEEESRTKSLILALATERPITGTHHHAMKALSTRNKIGFCKLTITNKRNRHVKVLALPSYNGMDKREFLRPTTSLAVNRKICKGWIGARHPIASTVQDQEWSTSRDRYQQTSWANRNPS